MRTIYSFTTATLATASALLFALPVQAQEDLAPPASSLYDEDLPPVESLEPEAIESSSSSPGGKDYGVFAPLYPGMSETDRLIEGYPALIESSGTWLRRGFWFTEVDAVLVQRRTGSRSMVLGRELGAGTPFGAALPTFNNILEVNNGPGAEALPRIKVGRFLFRDEYNRDHTAEFVWYGAGAWNQAASILAATPDGLSVPSNIDRSNNLNLAGELPINVSNISFDGARSMAIDYRSELDSFEWNYHVKDRMERDQMILRPDGEWVRRATPSVTRSFLAGMRYLNTKDSLLWTATGIPTTAAGTNRGDGSYDIATDNNLFGTQLGFTYTWERERWSFGTVCKGGGYYNYMQLDSTWQVLDQDDAVRASGDVHTDGSNLSFVGEFAAFMKWHLRPNLSVRMGAELLMIESLALSTRNLNFVNGGFDPIAHGGGNVFMGTSIGLETYW